jgi:5-methylcytosine-specific restriction endonuclease McrA
MNSPTSRSSAPDPRPKRRIVDAATMRPVHIQMQGEPCQRCERRIGVAIHHKVFRSQGGDDRLENFEWLCQSCHDEAHGL